MLPTQRIFISLKNEAYISNAVLILTFCTYGRMNACLVDGLQTGSGMQAHVTSLGSLARQLGR